MSPRGRPARRRGGGRRPPSSRRPRPDQASPRRGSRGLGGEQVEGRQAVRELLVAGRRRVRDVWLADDVDEAPILGDITDLAAELRVPVRRVSRPALDAEARSEAPQGILAHAAPLEETDLEVLCGRDAAGGQPPFLLGLDGVTDPQNLGALLRTAVSAGVSGVLLPRHRAAHVTPTVTKAAAGAVEHVPLAVVSGLPAALARARDLGVWIVGLDSDGSRSVFDLELASEPIALVLGAEGRGLGRLTRERCDVVAAIPLRGPLASLNVAAAGAVACFEVARRRLP